MTCANSIPWYIYFVKIPNETISLVLFKENAIFFIKNIAFE